MEFAVIGNRVRLGGDGTRDINLTLCVLEDVLELLQLIDHLCPILLHLLKLYRFLLALLVLLLNLLAPRNL